MNCHRTASSGSCRLHRRLSGLLPLALLLLGGCTAKKGPSSVNAEAAAIAPSSQNAAAATSAAAPAEAAARAKPWDPAHGTAAVKGTIKFSGQPPRRRPLDMGAQAQCAAQHQEPVLDETVIVNANGTLKNVFVWVKKGLDGWQFTAPKEAVALDQKGCVFVPHVVGVQVGQPLKIRNDDPFLHNVHGFPRRNAQFNIGQPSQGEEAVRTFKNVEVAVKVKCDVHGWMGAHVGVVGHPYFAITGDEGAFELKGLPPGQYTIEAWHEQYGVRTAEVTLTDGEAKEIELSFQG